MNVITAAAQAGVTPATIRIWCRRDIVTATKAAGRWVIDQASLAYRIALAALKTRKATMDLTATTITTRTRGGNQITSVTGIAPLLADRIAAIADEGDRLHTLETLRTARVYLRSIGDEDTATGSDTAGSWCEQGRIATDYRGTRDLPVSVALDLAAAIRTAIAAL